MMRNFRFIFILLLSVSCCVFAQDSISVTDKLQNNLSPVTTFSSVSEYNPGAKVYTLLTGLSDLNIGYEKQTGKAGLLEAGTAFDNYAFSAESYAKTGKHHIWGKASYMNKRTDNIRWNESSDYYTIYPYVLADSVGGNNLNGEKYSFMGGYAQKLDNISWGVQLGYWALMEYRKIDPRPKNNTSNLVFSAGLNYKLTVKYAVGGGFMLRKYKQRNDLSFNNVLGRPSFHHMTGFGTDAYWFSNEFTGCLFDGKGYGGNLQLLPTDGKGLSVTLAYENFSFEKMIDNNQNPVISSIDEDKFTLNTSYQKQIEKHSVGIKLEASYTNRQGTEEKFTKDGQMLVNISSEKQYKNELTAIDLTFIYQQNGVNTFWYVMPYISYSTQEESHKASERKMKISHIDFGLRPGISKLIKKHLLHIDANLGYTKNLDSSIDLNGLSTGRSITQTLLTNYDYLSSNGLIVGLSARFDYALPQKNMTIYLKAMWDYKKYDKVNSNLLGINLGVVF